MKLDNMFKKTKHVSNVKNISKANTVQPEVPEGLLKKCNKCGKAIVAEDAKANYNICQWADFRFTPIEGCYAGDDNRFEEWIRIVFRNPDELTKGMRKKSRVFRKRRT